METVIPIFELAFLALFVLLYLLAPLLSCHRCWSVEKWSLWVFVWTLAAVVDIYLLLKFQAAFYVDSVAFWCLVVALMFEIVHRMGEALFPNERLSREEVYNAVIDEASKYLNIPPSQIARDCNLLLLKENGSETDILFLIFLVEKKLGLQRSGGISEIRTIDEIVDYLQGKNINKKYK